MTIDINRAELLAVANLVKPAVAVAAFIPALQHIQFKGGYALAFNDISAISVRCDVPIERCVPGDLLLRALGAFKGDRVAMTLDPKNGSMLLQSGRSKIKVPTLSSSDFQFDLPADAAPELTLTPDVIKGIERCMMSVNNDPKHPAGMGVTLESDAGRAVLYATDNWTISRYRTDATVTLPGDAPVILPTFFCEQLIVLAKAFPKEKPLLVLLPGGLLADFGQSASVFTRTLVDLEPLEFARILQKHAPAGAAEKLLQPVPEGLDGAVSRGLLVLSGEVVKTTRIQAGTGNMTLASMSELGEVDDAIDWAGAAVHDFRIDPELLARALKVCTKIALMPKALVLTRDEFTHLIGHVTR